MYEVGLGEGDEHHVRSEERPSPLRRKVGIFRFTNCTQWKYETVNIQHFLVMYKVDFSLSIRQKGFYLGIQGGPSGCTLPFVVDMVTNVPSQYSLFISGQTKRWFSPSYEDEYSGLNNFRIFVFVRIFVYGRIFGFLPNIRQFYRIYGQLQSKPINF